MAIPEDEDVEKTLTRIMSQQSPLMKQARTQGLQSAQQKGLGQSTMAIQAAQAAAYNTAMPIASQQTQQAHQTGMQTSQFGHETGMQTASFTHAADQAQKDRNASLQQLHTSAELTRFGQAEAAAQERQTLGLQQSFEANMKQLDRSMQERIVSMELSSADRERAAQAFVTAENTYAQSFAGLQANENLPADTRDRYLSHINSVRQSNFDMLTSLYRSSGQIPW